MKKHKWILLIIGLLAVGLICYGLFFYGNNETAGPGSPLPPSQEDPVPEDPREEPAEGPDSQEEPVPEPEPQGPASGPEPEEEPDSGVGSKYTIFVDQQLVIPVYGKGGATESIVINSGIISSKEKQIALTFDADGYMIRRWIC